MKDYRFPAVSEFRRVLTPATPWARRERLEKGARVNIRISAEEKVEVEEYASLFGLSISGYLIRLHRLAVAIQGARSRKGRRSSPKVN
jgi:hypothetical protein